jgi:hypothetical protein
LALPAPGGQATCKTGQCSADATRVLGASFARRGRGRKHGLGGRPWRRAEAGADGVWDGKGAEEGRSGALLGALWVAPLPRLMVLPWGAMAMAVCVVDSMPSAAARALIEAVPIVAGAQLRGAWGRWGDRS